MHVKTIVFDGIVVLTGSCNMTHNGLENNKEHMFRITEPVTVADVNEDFELTWNEALPVTGKMISDMISSAEKAKEKKRAKSVSVCREERPPRKSVSGCFPTLSKDSSPTE